MLRLDLRTSGTCSLKFTCFFLFLFSCIRLQAQPVWINAAEFSPEQKFSQLFMVDGPWGNDSTLYTHSIAGIQLRNVAKAPLSRLEAVRALNAAQRHFVQHTPEHIPVIIYEEALHGLLYPNSTVFPQSVALAASWDTALMSSVASAVARECRSFGVRQVLSPVLNLATDPRWGRTEETYGEDPLLASRMGLVYVRTLENAGIVTTPKHFAANHGDGGRDSYPIHFSEEYLDRTYLVPFRTAVTAGHARSIMAAYNSLNGRPCSANDELLNEKLKKEWGFRGFAISDAGGTGGALVLHHTAASYDESGKQAIENGLDVILQTDIRHFDLFKGPFSDGKVRSAALDSSFQRVLQVKKEIGLFNDPYIQEKDTLNAAEIKSHRALALKAAEESFVLLKNDTNKVLPISTAIHSIALIGPDAVEARLGGYSGTGIAPVSILQGLRNDPARRYEVNYAEGCGRGSEAWKVIEPKYFMCDTNNHPIMGIHAAFYNNVTGTGTPACERIDESVNYQWTFMPPASGVDGNFFSARWSGMLLSPETGDFEFGIHGNDGYRLYIGDQLLLDTWDEQGSHTRMIRYHFEKEYVYPIRLICKEPTGNAVLQMVWTIGVHDSTEEKIAQAVQLASASDMILICAGINEGEFLDRSHLELPGKQEEMILRLAALHKPIAVLLSGGSAVTMSRWIDRVNAVMDLWYPGEAGGEAVAAVLNGRVSPSGKLPLTFPESVGQLPLVYNHEPTGRGDDYADASGLPLFPFGYGLSYTRFTYDEIDPQKLEFSGTENRQVLFTLRNTGAYDGDEVVQVYANQETGMYTRPVQELIAFQRVPLKHGESKEVRIELPSDYFQKGNTYRLMIGSSSRDIRLHSRIVVK